MADSASARFHAVVYSRSPRRRAKEAFVFTGRLLARRVKAALVKIPHETEDEAAICYAASDGLSAVAIVDKSYPDRVVAELLRGLVDGMRAEHGMTWRAATVDYSQKLERLDKTLAAAQDPAKIDALTSVSAKLTEVKAIMQVRLVDASGRPKRRRRHLAPPATAAQ